MYTETPTRMPNIRQRDVCQMHQNELQLVVQYIVQLGGAFDGSYCVF